MKHLTSLVILLIMLTFPAISQVAINTTGAEAAASAMLDISSTEKGMLAPRMTTAQRTAIASPANGLLVYDTDTKSFWHYNATDSEWVQVASGELMLNDLGDAKTDGNSVFIGPYSGVSNSGTDNCNTSVGYEALRDVTTGFGNTALGYNGLKENTTGSRNTAIGYYSMLFRETGVDNTAVGYAALRNNISGSMNVAIGDWSNYWGSDGSYNTYIGARSGANSSGDDNCGVGHMNMYYNIGDRNTSIGNYAGYNDYDPYVPNEYSGCVLIGYAAGSRNNSDNKLYIENSNSSYPLIGGDFSTNQVDINGTIKITGGTPGNGKVLTSDADGLSSWQTPSTYATELNDLSDAITDGNSVFIGSNSGVSNNGTDNMNTSLGYQAVKDVTTGDCNTALGYLCLTENTTGKWNTVIGSNSATTSNGDENTIVGSNSFRHNRTGSSNIAMGIYVLSNNTTGNNNTAIGQGALMNNRTGNNNTVLGYYAGSGSSLYQYNGCVFLGNYAGHLNTSDNKLYIENSDSEYPLIGGDFSTNQVDINGTIKITGGTPGNGKVLTSDANGLASWEENLGATELNDLSDAITDGNSVFIGTNSGTSNTGSGNTALGYYSLEDNTTGYNNTAIGGYAMFSNTTGNKNTAIGAEAILHNTTGSANTAIGIRAILSNTTGSNNTAMGYYVMEKNNDGEENTAVGLRAANENISGSSNTVVGYHSNYYNQNGDNNTILGYQAGRGSAVHDKSGNIFLGFQAGYNETGDNKLYIENSNSSTPLIGGDFDANQVDINGTIKITGGTPGNGKVLTSDADGLAVWQTPEINDLSDAAYNGSDLFLGNGAGESNSGTNSNVAVGKDALKSNTSNERNTAVGNLSLELNTGERNTALGYYSMRDNTTGSFNTSLGYRTGFDNVTGSNNTFVGYNARMTSSTIRVNSTAIGNDAVITASDQVRIGNDDVSSIGGQVAWTTLSDGRFKENIKEDVAGLDFVLNLRPVSYNVNKQAFKSFIGSEYQSNFKTSSQRECGFVAQEVEELIQKTGVEFNGVDAPENSDDYYGIRYSQFVVPLVKSVQELNEKLEKENTDQTAEIEELKEENEALKARLEKLENMMLKK